MQLLKPFPKFNAEDFKNMPLLIKAKGKCTTDHISMAGIWLKFRGHLENISDNMLMGAVNYFNDKTNCVFNQLSGNYEEVSKVAKEYKLNNISSIVVAEENYGEGSSREHAAMEPRFLNVKVILVKSFARIHETNLKKQGMLAITFKDKNDYDKIKEKDIVLSFSLELKEELKKILPNVDIVLTRDKDTYPTLQERYKIANTAAKIETDKPENALCAGTIFQELDLAFLGRRCRK